MEDVGPNPMDDGHEITEISSLEAIKENLNYLNADLEKDLQRLDEANQILFRKIQKKEESVQSLEKDIALSIGRVPEKDDFSEIIIQKENALKDLKLETAKLEKKNKTLSKNIMELQKKISRGYKNTIPDPETLKNKIAELKVKLQKLTESCVQQEEEIAKMESDYQSINQLCEDQAHYIKWNIPISDFEIKTKHLVYDVLLHGKKYQEILREMEKKQEVMLLEKEISKAQNDSSQVVKAGATLEETIQNDMEKIIIKKQERKFLLRHFRYLFFMVIIFLRLLGYMVFHLQYINPDLLVDTLPMLMSRSTLKWLRDIVFPFLTLEVEDVLPH
ncbi:transmembrane and coiled-coil domain-containing protein 5B-like protein [Cricetulus griseus]|nr:transmembrane and coiled-coil domain-containing protein 5B-like protein [Cricetulus griseus]